MIHTHDVVTHSIRVLIVDDHALVRAGIAGILRSTSDISVVGECGDSTKLIGLVDVMQPDVVLMDLRMPKMSGLEATQALMYRWPDTKVLILTGSISRHTLEEAATVGARGFLLKGGDPLTLATAVRTLASGGTVWPSL